MILSLCLNAAGESPPLAPTPPLPPFYSTSPPCTWFTTLGFTTLPSGSYTSLWRSDPRLWPTPAPRTTRSLRRSETLADQPAHVQGEEKLF